MSIRKVCNMSWFRNPFKKRRTTLDDNPYRRFFEDYPRANDWVIWRQPHRVAIRTFQARDGRWRNQIIDESPERIGNRKALGVTPGSGYATEEIALEYANVMRQMEPSTVEGKVFTDRNGRYRWRLVRHTSDGEEIIQNTAGAGFDTEIEARCVLGRVLYAHPKREIRG